MSSIAAAPSQVPSKRPPSQLRVRVTGYCCQLIKLGVPKADAWEIAVAIAKYDERDRIPKPAQQDLIHQYCSLICRAKLWRSDLLLTSRA